MFKKNYNFTYTSYFKKKILKPKNINQLKKYLKYQHTIVGNLRSYNDSIIGFNKYISLSNFNKILNLNKKKKIVEVESGLKLYELNNNIIKKKLILSCSPGCKYVSIGGMIANNISGKLVAYNSIKDHIVSIKILNNKNKIIECSKIKNKKLFFLTIGGKGRTGPIISAKLKLEKINSLDIFQEIFSFESYKKFFETFVKLKKYKYAVCWIDFTKKDFDGLIFAGKHINNNKKIDNNYSDLMLPKILIFILSFFISFKFFTIFFNYFFKIKNLLKKKKILPFNNFFFPQNKILNWNDLFKKNGFIQFQFYLKRKNLKSLVNSLKFSLKDNSLFSNFAIIKFHNKSKVSFNRISLSLDFPIKNNYHIIKKIINYHVNKFDLEVELSKDISLSKLNNKTFKANPIFDKKNNKYFFDNFNSKLIERLK